MDRHSSERWKQWTVIGGYCVLGLALLILHLANAGRQATLIVLIIIFAAWFSLLWLIKRAERNRQRQILEKIPNVRSVRKTKPLTPADEVELYELINNEIGEHIFVGIVIGGVAALIGHLIFQADSWIVWTMVILIIIGWTAGRMLYRKKRAAQYISKSGKTILRGIITQKEIVNGGDSSDTFYISFDTVELNVKRWVYDKYEVGELAEFHIYPPLGNYVLYEEKLEKL